MQRNSHPVSSAFLKMTFILNSRITDCPNRSPCCLTWSVWQCLAVGAGFAYYSLSSVLISQAGHLELGTVALVSNILREAIALVLIPFAVKFLPGHAVISMAGCTTMDTTFPVLVRTLGMDWAFVCILHAMVLDFSVPFWVAFYCSLF